MNDHNDFKLKLMHKDNHHDHHHEHTGQCSSHKEAPVKYDMNEHVKKKLLMVCAICFLFMVIEVIGGYLANSLAIMADAAHLLSDLAGFIISILAIYFAKLPANNKLTFGYHRAEIIGALLSVFLIWMLTIILLFEALARLIDSHHTIDGLLMVISSTIGLIFNSIMAYILHSGVRIGSVTL